MCWKWGFLIGSKIKSSIWHHYLTLVSRSALLLSDSTLKSSNVKSLSLEAKLKKVIK